MRLNRTTEEFVRHHRLLVERTRNDPSNTAKALEEFPELETSIERLQEIGQAVETHQYLSKRRFIVQAHPEFQRARKDFGSRWASAYDAVRNRKYMRAALQVSAEFVRGYGLLIARTGNDPAMVTSLREQQSDLADAIWWLDEIIFALDEPGGYGEQEKYGSESEVSQFIAKAREVGRLIGQAPLEFREAITDFRLRWADACAFKTATSLEELFGSFGATDHGDVDAEKSSEFARDWLGQLLDNLPDMPGIEERLDEPAESRPFDPSRDRVDCAIWWLADVYGKDPLFVENFGYTAGEALTWISETVGLNLSQIECRWLEFPVIVVPQHVSDQYGLESPRGLYASLTQIRLAYMIGADLAALALCRSVTELLVRFHYAHDIPGAAQSKGKGSTNLKWLIEQVQSRSEFDFLKRFNLTQKVDEANDILHQARTDVTHREHDRGLVGEWVRVLAEMIDRAPGGGPASVSE